MKGLGLYAAAAAASAVAVHAVTLRLADYPWGAPAMQFLDGDGWTVNGPNMTFGGIVPGDLLSDMQRAGLMGDPLYELNFQTTAMDAGVFTYSTTFDLDPAVAATAQQYLVFDGVKMVADITLNGQYINSTSDMFLRYAFPVTSVLKPSGNVLQVAFAPFADRRNSELRWSACTGGWDWAPPSTVSSCGQPTFTKAIWKPVSIVGTGPNGAAIESVVPQIRYAGAYPTEPLSDDAHGPFNVTVRVHFAAPIGGAVTGTVGVATEWGASASVPVSLPLGTAAGASVTVDLGAAGTQAAALWWPNGLGAQTMYGLNVTFTPTGSAAPAMTVSRRIGFRVFVLVTADDSNPAALAGLDGSGNLTMRWKVNGADILARGGNMIPMDELEARLDDAAHRRLVQSAAEAGFNAFRLWGGGIWPPTSWYEACDEFGILIYHDAMYGQGHPPTATPTQDAELRYQVRRLSSSPSIAQWDACNECDGSGLYASFVMTTIAEEDTSRAVWPSCPSQGWNGGVDRLWSTPNGNTLNPREAREDAILGSKTLVPALPTSSQAALEAATCSFIDNVDFNPGPIHQTWPAASAQDCCALCAAAGASCAASVFAFGTCYSKNATDLKTVVWASGRTACWPPSAGPAPAPPAPQPTGTIETHGPYQHGGGWPAYNGGCKSEGCGNATFNANLPASLSWSPGAVGTASPGVFASEFGSVAFSSFESFAPMLAPAHWGVHGGMGPDVCTGGFNSHCTAPDGSPGNPMAQRNYPADNFLLTYFKGAPATAGINDTGAAAFSGQLYLQQIAQLLEMQGDITNRRSKNDFGIIEWQYGEIWPTGGWGSIEYGSNVPGQVAGGRWKPLQYLFARSLFRDVYAACGSLGQCFVRNDYPLAPFTGTVALSFASLRSFKSTTAPSANVALPRGAGAASGFCLASGTGDGTSCPPLSTALTTAGCAPDGSDCVLAITVTNGTGAVVSTTEQLLAPPYLLSGLQKAAVSFSIGDVQADGSVPITVYASQPALFVTLTTLAQGRFTDNAFHVVGSAGNGSRTVSFIPWAPLQADVLAQTLRVEHVAQYIL